MIPVFRSVLSVKPRTNFNLEEFTSNLSIFLNEWIGNRSEQFQYSISAATTERSSDLSRFDNVIDGEGNNVGRIHEYQVIDGENTFHWEWFSELNHQLDVDTDIFPVSNLIRTRVWARLDSLSPTAGPTATIRIERDLAGERQTSIWADYPVFSPPSISYELSRRFVTESGNVPVDNKYWDAKGNAVSRLVEVIESLERKLPIVVVSSPYINNDKEAINVPSLARRLSGVARVAHVKEREAQNYFCRRLPSAPCYDGTVQVYPGDFTRHDPPARHRFWTRRVVSKMDDPVNEVSSILIRSGALTTQDDQGDEDWLLPRRHTVQRTKLGIPNIAQLIRENTNISILEPGEEWEAVELIISEYQTLLDGHDRLTLLIKQQHDELDELRQDKYHLMQRVEFAEGSSSLDDPVIDDQPLCKDLAEALNQVNDHLGGDHVVILPRAWDSAKKGACSQPRGRKAETGGSL